MARGAEDYSNVTSLLPTHRLDDMGEISARLHSPVVYDRGGSVVFLSRFKYGVAQFKLNPVGAGATIAASPDTFLTGPFSMRFVTSAVTDQVSTASISIPIPDTETKMGYEAAFAFDADNIAFSMQLSYYNAPDLYQYTMFYKSDEEDLSITTLTGNVILLEDHTIRKRINSWHRMKFVVDLDTNYYVRAMFDEHRFDCSAYQADHQATTESNRIDIRLQVYAREAASKSLYWDDIIVTQAEP